MDLAFSKRFTPTSVWLLAPILLLVLVAVTYRDAPDNVFHLDDGRNIFRYPPVMVTELTAGNVIDAGRNSFLPARPLPGMTFAIDWWRGGGSPRPFQLTNMVIHGATAVAIFGLLFLVLGRLQHPLWIVAVASLAGAAIWACHPIQVQGVTYIVQRMSSMAALFTVLTVVMYVLGRGAGRVWRRWLYFGLGALCWFLGLASKETAAIAPFLILLAEYGVLRYGQALVRNKMDLVMLSLPALVAGFIVIDVVSGVGPLSATFLPGFESRDFTLTERLLTQPRVIGFHLSQFLWPSQGRFSLEHDFVVSTGLLTPGSTLTALLGVAAWCGLGVWSLFRSSSRAVGFFLLWVPATLIIESTLVPLEMVFEHRMYLPSVGLAGLVAMGVCWMLKSVPRLIPLTLISCCGIIALLVLSSSQYVPVWNSTLSLAQNNTKHAPSSARAWGTLAEALRNTGKSWDIIMPPMMRSLALNPNETVALNLRAIQLIEERRLDEAEEILDRLAPRARRDHSILNTIGMLRFEQGDMSGAINQFEQVVKLNGFESGFRYNLALSYELSGRCRDAHEAWRAFLYLETDEKRRSTVMERLSRNFATVGGRCFGISK